MSDYSQLSDAELSRRIAELQGYSVYHYNDLNPYYLLLDSDGIPAVLGREGHRATEADAWNDAPNYASDLNAAAELLRGCFGELTWDGEAWQVEAFGYLYATHPTNPARAVCEAWLQWREGQKP